MAKQKKASKEEGPASTSISTTFGRNYYIKGYGSVKVGDKVTKEAEDAWNAISSSKMVTSSFVDTSEKD